MFPYRGIGNEIAALGRDTQVVLNQYGGLASHAAPRALKWLLDEELRAIVERDYAELANVLVPDQAWKSAVVLAGSIFEAILVDLLTNRPDTLALARASKSAPRDKNRIVKAEGDWTLHNMIEISTELGLIPADRAKTFDQVLRDYRNFVHPRKELRAAHPCGEGEALMAKGALDAICDHFDRTL